MCLRFLNKTKISILLFVYLFIIYTSIYLFHCLLLGVQCGDEKEVFAEKYGLGDGLISDSPN